MADASHTTFIALPVPGLRPLGISGRQPQVRCVDAALVVQDEHGGTATIPAADVHWMRIGKSGTSSGTFLVARIGLAASAESESLLLRAANPYDRAFAPVLRSFARAVASARGPAALQQGTGTSAGTFVVVLLITLLATVLALTVWAREFGTTGAVVFTALMGIIAAAVGWDSLYRSRPRPISSLDELDRVLR